jgi:hypothetical protein
MGPQKLRGSWLVGVLAMATGGACSQPPSSPAGNADIGQLQLALTASSPAGGSYRLVSPTFLITGNGNGPSTSIVLTGDTPTLEQDLAPGSYSIQLLDGFSIVAVESDGSETPLSATLISQNPVPFGIRSQHTTSVSFQFKVGEVIVTMGTGTVRVIATVDDGLIDDFEDGDGQIAPLGGRNGTWFTFNDTSGTQTPAPNTVVIPEVDPYTTNYFLHSSGTGFALSNGNPFFGAGVGTDLRDGPSGALPYDASGYGGVTFTFSFSSSELYQAGVALRFNVSTSATTPVQFGGTCTEGCFDDFGTTLIPGGYYYGTQSVTIPFSGLSQAGFGTPVAFDPGSILTIKWNITWNPPLFYPYPPVPPNDFDLTLDNISFTPGHFTGSDTDGGSLSPDGGAAD